MKLNWNFQRGGGGGRGANPFRGEVWIFSGTTHSVITWPAALCMPATANTDPQLFHCMFITAIDVSIKTGSTGKRDHYCGGIAASQICFQTHYMKDKISNYVKRKRTVLILQECSSLSCTFTGN